jgi:S1-C subfamily serine protease
LRF